MNATVKTVPFDTENHLPLVTGFSAFIKEAVKSTAGNTQLHDQPCYYLNSGQLAYASESLLITPEDGDLVMCVKADNEYFIIQVLRRQQSAESLRIVSSKPIDCIAPDIRFRALNELELFSGNKLTLYAGDIINNAKNTFVQQAHNLLQQAKTFSLTTKGLMKLQGRQQVVVAEEDLRMDAKRINMG